MPSLADKIRARMAAQGTMRATTEDPTAPPPKTRDLVRTNRWDERTWKVARRQKAIDGLIEDLYVGDQHKGGEREGFDPAAELTAGLFQSLYKVDPELIKPRDLEREVFPAHKLLKALQENPQYQELHETTMSDPWLSAIAVDTLSEAVKTALVQMPPPPPLPGGQPDNGPCQGQGQGGQGGQGGTDPSNDPGQGDGQGQGQGDPDDDLNSDDTGTGSGSGSQDYDDWDADGPDLDDLMNQALSEAKDEVEDIDNGLKGIGLDAGQWRSMPDDERKKIIDRLRTPEMKALADMIGRMRRFALGARATRVVSVPHEAYDVETGRDLQHVLKSEFALLGNDQTTYEFYRRYADGELLQFKLRGTEDAGKGPIVCCVDKSYSMSGPPMRWAVSVAEALRRFAADDDRDFMGLFFGANDDRVRFQFPKGTGPVQKILDFIGTVADGGTQFDGILTEALERASVDQEKSDIVFITDGMAHLTDEWIAEFTKRRKEANVRLFSVFIGGSADMQRKSPPLTLLESFSDAVINVHELTPQAMTRVFQAV